MNEEDVAAALLAEAQAFLVRRIVPIVVEPNTAGVAPRIYTGFVIEVRERWFWITAAHCAQHIEDALRQLPAATLSLLTGFLCPTKTKVAVPRREWSFVDLQKSALIFAERLTRLDSAEAHRFDGAIWPIPDLIACYLMGRGVKAFRESEVVPTAAQFRRLARAQVQGLFVGGVPWAAIDVDTKSSRLIPTLMTFPLHPSPDGHLPADQRREFEEEGRAFAWIPTDWPKNIFNESLEGVSGGPVIQLTDAGVVLLGLQSVQYGKGKKPDRVGVFSLEATLHVLKDCLREHGTIFNIERYGGRPKRKRRKSAHRVELT